MLQLAPLHSAAAPVEKKGPALLTDDELLHRLAFEDLRIPERKKGRLFASVSSPAELFNTRPVCLRKLGFKEEEIRTVREYRFDRVERCLAILRRLGAGCTWPGEAAYPLLLNEIANAPRMLTFRGKLTSDLECVAIVGSRNASPYGIDVARKLGRDLARLKLCVASGAARGVDGAALSGALHAGGETVAVLGSGIDIPYPKEHAGLIKQIAEQGVVLSEFLPGEPPRSQNFPRRNRIISGVSRAVVVVEARPKSGSLITARLAIEQDREVLAVPHDLETPGGGGMGPNGLIRDGGARLLTSALTILEELPWRVREELLIKAGQRLLEELPSDHHAELETGESVQERLLSALSRRSPRTPEQLAERAGIPPSEVLGNLTFLELQGRVEKMPGLRYVLRTIT